MRAGIVPLNIYILHISNNNHKHKIGVYQNPKPTSLVGTASKLHALPRPLKPESTNFGRSTGGKLKTRLDPMPSEAKHDKT